MKSDRRLNGWVMIASILGIVSGLVLILAGAGLGIFGFLKPEELLRIDELVFFINQKGIDKAQIKLLDGLLKFEWLFVTLGTIMAVVGLIALIFAIVEINYAKKRKIVKHRIALLVFTLIPLAIAGCVGAYLYFEWDALTDIIKYICYGLGGVFAFIALCNIMGVIFGRSEKFMSNDNNKYAFGGNTMRNARATANQNVRDAQQQTNVATPQNVQQIYQPQGQVQPRPQVQAQPRSQVAQTPLKARPMQSTRPQINANAQSTARPVGTMNAGVAPRTMQHASQIPPRPTIQQTQQVRRPATPNQSQPRPQQSTRPISSAPKKYCIRCGKLLNPDEKVCTMCGARIVQ